jgi:hypothetical protein
MESFNAANEQQLLVSGLKDTVALTLGSRGEVVSRVVVELMLDVLGTASTHILRTGWLPHSSSACFVLTKQFLRAGAVLSTTRALARRRLCRAARRNARCSCSVR